MLNGLQHGRMGGRSIAIYSAISYLKFRKLSDRIFCTQDWGPTKEDSQGNLISLWVDKNSTTLACFFLARQCENQKLNAGTNKTAITIPTVCNGKRKMAPKIVRVLRNFPRYYSSNTIRFRKTGFSAYDLGCHNT